MRPAAAAGQPTPWTSPTFVGAIAASFLAHAAMLAMLVAGQTAKPSAPSPPPTPIRVTMVLPAARLPAVKTLPPLAPIAPFNTQSDAPSHSSKPVPRAPGVAQAEPERSPVSMEAPPPPIAEEWLQAASYKLKNSKRYRYAWGQQVRSMMGTAVEGPEQGDVRFRVEIAPDGHLARLDTIWSTSDTAERLARDAMGRMPPLPPTPTGKPLVFEKTISFQPQDRGWPPIYKYDCLPDPEGFKNPFAWDGSSNRSAATRNEPDEAALESMSAADLEACARSLPTDTLEAVTVDQQRQFKTWGSQPLNGVNR
jgi:hypothetical protein